MCPFAPCPFFPFHSWCPPASFHQPALRLASAPPSSRPVSLSSVCHPGWHVCFHSMRSPRQITISMASKCEPRCPAQHLSVLNSRTTGCGNCRLNLRPCVCDTRCLASHKPTNAAVLSPCKHTILCLCCHDQWPLCPSNDSSRKPGSRP